MDNGQLLFPGIEPPVESKAESRREAFRDNKISHRLIWIREKLSLRATTVCEDLSLPSSTFCDRESGVRTCLYEEIRDIANYFNKKWQEKYLNSHYPNYGGQEVDHITMAWLMFGRDELLDEHKKTIELLRQNYREKEKELVETIMELKANARS